MKKIAAAIKINPIKIAQDYASLAFGPGRILFADYTKLRLFDETFYAGNDRRQVVGQRRNCKLVLAENYRYDWMGLFANKVASSSYLDVYGIRTVPVTAIYAEGLSSNSARLLRNAGELRAFLENSDNYPPFLQTGRRLLKPRLDIVKELQGGRQKPRNLRRAFTCGRSFCRGNRHILQSRLFVPAPFDAAPDNPGIMRRPLGDTSYCYDGN